MEKEHAAPGLMPHATHITRYMSPATSHLFKATLDIRDHHLSGLMVIKRTETPPLPPPQTGSGENTGIFRIVFVNEVGMTFFDLELGTDNLRVISCFGSLNKKALMRIFETDFRMLTWDGVLSDTQEYSQEGSDNLVLSGKAGRYRTWQTYSPGGDTLLATAAKSTMADPVIIVFDKYTGGSPAIITIENPFIRMKLRLKRLS